MRGWSKAVNGGGGEEEAVFQGMEWTELGQTFWVAVYPTEKMR